MAINETRVHFRPGAQITGRPSTSVLAKRFITVAAGRNALNGESVPIKPADAGAWALGVPATDCPAGEDKVVAVYAGSGYQLRVQCGAAIDASAGPVAVKVGSAGKVVPQGGSGVIVAYAFSTTTADGQDVEVRLV